MESTYLEEFDRRLVSFLSDVGLWRLCFRGVTTNRQHVPSLMADDLHMAADSGRCDPPMPLF